MKSDLRCWLEDLARYPGGVRARLLARPGAGPDYGGPDHREQAYRTVEALHPRSMRLRVAEVREETPSTRTFRLERTDGPLPPFRPGQYVSLAVTVGAVRTTRAYSISSPPGVGHLDLTVRREPAGFVSPFLFERAVPGWEVTTSGPTGSFVHEPLIDRGAPLLIAGGSGITPFMSMIRDQARRGWGCPIDLLYGSRTADDVIFGDELAALAAAHDELGYRLVLSEPGPGYDGPAGLLGAEQIRAVAGDLRGRTVLICGPAAMAEHTGAALAELGVPAHKLRRERFGPPADVTRAPGWPPDLPATRRVRVEVVGHRTFTAAVGEPLLHSLERHGLPHRSSCRTGECADCRVRVRSGTAFEVAPGVRQADRALGVVHACASYPLEDLVIELL